MIGWTNSPQMVPVSGLPMEVTCIHCTGPSLIAGSPFPPYFILFLIVYWGSIKAALLPPFAHTWLPLLPPNRFSYPPNSLLTVRLCRILSPKLYYTHNTKNAFNLFYSSRGRCSCCWSCSRWPRREQGHQVPDQDGQCSLGMHSARPCSLVCLTIIITLAQHKILVISNVTRQHLTYSYSERKKAQRTDSTDSTSTTDSSSTAESK